MTNLLVCLTTAVLGFILIWIALDHSNIVVAVCGGMLFGGGVACGMFGR
jgi:hypothetical protein